MTADPDVSLRGLTLRAKILHAEHALAATTHTGGILRAGNVAEEAILLARKADAEDAWEYPLAQENEPTQVFSREHVSNT